MLVRENDVAAIVLGLIAELDIRPGGRVAPENLARQWRGIGLRRDDLDRGLSLLLRDGFLVAEHPPGQRPTYMLTRAGYRRMERLDSPLTLGLASYQRLRHKAARRQDGAPPAGPVGPAAPPPGRRNGESGRD